ncbi:MAG: protein-glutamate O-methyltransferase CheR [Bdellovibrionaceae bacterium]|jgi:chemotaxis protein methyltransferase CheR|nr:protein-glutamate O-methyltransferase CheR [Pseudobdellovibrionaceae bacterium]
MTDDKILEYFAKYIYDHTGIMYTDTNFYQLERRLQSLCTRFDAKDFAELRLMYSQNKTSEMHQLLVDLATNNETSFYRDGHPFKVLADEIIPSILVNNKDSKTLNIWSAGCSMGQEPYSILMILEEQFPELKSWRVQLNATDISTVALDKTESGVYTQLEVQRGLPIKKLMQYFTQIEDGSYQVKDFIKKNLTVKPFNLFTDTNGISQFDIVFCRNVLIYQNVENKKKIIQNLTNSLKPGGCLFLGNGESLIGIDSELENERHEKVTVFRKPVIGMSKAA